MQPAQEAVARVLAGLAMHDPRIPVAANVTGSLVTTAPAARAALIRQVTGAVRWVECVQALEGRSLSVEGQGAGADVFIEVGPGKVLCGLLKQIDPGLNSLNVEDAASLEKTLAELKSA
jgi:[acyl-carrier-protein] S-malonyltransferase